MLGYKTAQESDNRYQDIQEQYDLNGIVDKKIHAGTQSGTRIKFQNRICQPVDYQLQHELPPLSEGLQQHEPDLAFSFSFLSNFSNNLAKKDFFLPSFTLLSLSAIKVLLFYITPCAIFYFCFLPYSIRLQS
jgi:hypothetical protein